jgi:hypothetical protein
VDAEIISKLENKVKTEKNAFILGVSSNPNIFKNIPSAIMDGTAIKTIARSNPFVLILKNGKIENKLSAKEYLTK